METKNLIHVEQFCTHHNVEVSFISSLHEMGLIEIVVVEKADYLAYQELGTLEKMIRLHQELGVNLEGIDVISNLLNRIECLQEELTAAKNRLKFFD
jgi:hypothetical protein